MRFAISYARRDEIAAYLRSQIVVLQDVLKEIEETEGVVNQIHADESLKSVEFVLRGVRKSILKD